MISVRGDLLRDFQPPTVFQISRDLIPVARNVWQRSLVVSSASFACGDQPFTCRSTPRTDRLLWLECVETHPKRKQLVVPGLGRL